MCTSFKVVSQDKAVVVGRSMEFGYDLQSKLLVFPRNYTYTAQNLPDKNIKPLTWKGKYGVVGLNGFNQIMVSDGINERGLWIGCLYLPGYAKYQTPTPELSGKLVSQIDFALWVLSNFENVAEVKKGIEDIAVWGMEFGELGMIPLHFPIHDAIGGSILVEYTDGKLHIFDNPLGVVTNSPDFTWHLTNLGNYTNLSATNVPGVTIQGETIKPIGQGSGMLGLPGDFTPPSRFIRAIALSQSAIPSKNAEEEVKTAFHILGSFDIPVGLTREKHGDKTFYEDTQWMTVSDLQNKIYYVKTYEEPSAQRIKLSDLNFEDKTVKTIEIKNANWYKELTVSASQ